MVRLFFIASLSLCQVLSITVKAQCSGNWPLQSTEHVEILNGSLTNTLDSLIRIELSCSSYDSTLFWLVSSRKSRESSILEITQRVHLSLTELTGCTFLQGRMVCFNGAELSNILRPLGDLVHVPVKPAHLPSGPVDFSTWYYSFSTNEVRLLGAYPIPCQDQ